MIALMTRNVLRLSLALCLLLPALPSQGQEDPVRLNTLIDLLQNEQPAFGVLSFDYSLDNARAMATSGLDFLFIDMEHSPFDIERLRSFLLGMTDKRSILAKGNLQPDVVPLVRIPAAAGSEELVAQVKQVLDVGPMVCSFRPSKTGSRPNWR
jgi:4-hydroxy-2-oxoheptanedioate aldolase